MVDTKTHTSAGAQPGVTIDDILATIWGEITKGHGYKASEGHIAQVYTRLHYMIVEQAVCVMNTANTRFMF
jgi:hypothetical protein